jgi:hypothetical protein
LDCTCVSHEVLRERAEREKAEGKTQIAGATSNQDFGYLVDPDGMLVEFNLGPRENFWGHHHYWHEQPLCAVNWYVENLGMQMPQVRDAATGQLAPRPLWNPCDVPIGEVSYPTFIRSGQLRIPIGNVRFANGTWSWYTRQCRFGRCGEGNDQPLARSRGQVVDHIGLFSTRVRDASSTMHFSNHALSELRNLSQEATTTTLRLAVDGSPGAAEVADAIRGLAGSSELTDVIFLGDIAAYEPHTGQVAVDVRTLRPLDGREAQLLTERAQRVLVDGPESG